jgi:DeoR/GlpR family transcriptional regulator of sugar metabolism
VSENRPDRILEVLKKNGEVHTKKVAELSKMSASVASKYLGLLEKDGKVVLREQKPFRFWKLKEKS